MKKLSSLLIFVGLAINVSGQDQPKNLKEAFKADWLIGTWETKNDDGQVVSSETFGWKIKDILMFKERKGVGGEVESFATMSLDVDEDKVLYHSFRNRYASIGEMKVEGDKVLRTTNFRRRKLSQEQLESRVASIVEDRLASGAVQEEGVEEAKQKARNYLQRSSGTRKWTYEKQGEDKLVMTRADKDESGQFVKGDPVTYTRKKE